jgi:hypothetical protein
LISKFTFQKGIGIFTMLGTAKEAKQQEKSEKYASHALPN